MTQEFVPYEQALELKELGFDEPCFKMSEHKKVCDEQSKPQGCQLHNLHCGYPDCTIDKSITPVPLPTFSQAFRWFREKYGLYSWITMELGATLSFCWIITGENKSTEHKAFFKSYEEAELACLIKLIEIVKEKK